MAERAGRTISKFVSEHVENSLKQEEEGSSFRPRVELIRQLKEKDEEISRLTEESRLMKQLANRLDKELKRYRMQPFVEKEYQGVRSYDRELIDLLKQEGVVDGEHLLAKLGIDLKEKEVVKAVDRQLENLEAYGLVEVTPRGWKWKR